MMRIVAAFVVIGACGGDDHPSDAAGGNIDPLHYAELQANARCR